MNGSHLRTGFRHKIDFEKEGAVNGMMMKTQGWFWKLVEDGNRMVVNRIAMEAYDGVVDGVVMEAVDGAVNGMVMEAMNGDLNGMAKGAKDGAVNGMGI
jgi:hypothetical protein